MDDEESAVEIRAQTGSAQLEYRRLDVNITTTDTKITHMTTETAVALAKIARFTHAIPATEKTKRAVEQTTRFKWRVAVYPVVLLAGIYEMANHTGAAQWIALAIIGVLGCVEGTQFLERFMDRKDASTRLPDPPTDPT